MGNIANVPEIINNYNAYTNGNKLIGVTGEMELPSFDAITEEVSGAGVLGTYETSTPGNYSSLTQDVVFRILDENIFSIMNPNELVDLPFRASAGEVRTPEAPADPSHHGKRLPYGSCPHGLPYM